MDIEMLLTIALYATPIIATIFMSAGAMIRLLTIHHDLLGAALIKSGIGFFLVSFAFLFASHFILAPSSYTFGYLSNYEQVSVAELKNPETLMKLSQKDVCIKDAPITSADIGKLAIGEDGVQVHASGLSRKEEEKVNKHQDTLKSLTIYGVLSPSEQPGYTAEVRIAHKRDEKDSNDGSLIVLISAIMMPFLVLAATRPR